MKRIKKDRVVPVNSDIRERHRKRQLKKKRVRFTIFCTCIVLLLALVVAAIIFLTPWFHVNTVIVEGNAQTQAADLIAASGIKKGQSVFAVRMDKVEAAVMKVPYVKTATAKRKLPNTIVITVTESHMVARIEQNGLQICIDEAGEVVNASAEPPAEVLAVTGVEVSGYTPGEPLVPVQEAQFKVLLNFLNVAQDTGCLVGMHTLDVTDTNRITFTYGQGLNIIVGDTYDLKQKWLTFVEAVKNLPANAKGEIDLRIIGEAHYNP